MRSRRTKLAIADLDAAFDYVASDDQAAAVRLIERMEAAVTVLGRHPVAGRLGV